MLDRARHLVAAIVSPRDAVAAANYADAVAAVAKKAGLGFGMFGVAGLLALYGVGVLLATVVLVLALVMDAWLAALIVAVVLLAGAGVTALLGKRRVEEAAPPVPTMAVENLKQDVDAVRHPENH